MVTSLECRRIREDMYEEEWCGEECQDFLRSEFSFYPFFMVSSWPPLRLESTCLLMLCVFSRGIYYVIFLFCNFFCMLMKIFFYPNMGTSNNERDKEKEYLGTYYLKTQHRSGNPDPYLFATFVLACISYLRFLGNCPMYLLVI